MKQLLLICLIPGWLMAQKEIEVNAFITHVTVYTSAAEINYEKELILQKGKSTIIFSDLSPFMISNSVNVMAEGAGVNIITVSERINYTKTKRSVSEQVASYRDSVKYLQKELKLTKCKSEALIKEKDLLFKGESIGGLTHGVSVAEIEKAANFFSKHYYGINAQLFELNEKEELLTAKINRFTQQIYQLETATLPNVSEIKVILNCKDERTVKFRFNYLTAKAGWAPLYDFKFNGASQPLHFVFRANVFNASGVPWNEISIKLSTANPIQGFAIPSLDDAPEKEKPQGDVKFKQIEVVNAITEYKIKEQYSIPTDAKPYLLDVNAYDMPSNYNYLLIPKLDPFGFLIAKIPNWNKYNLIPGTSNIYNNGTFMGKTFLDTYANDDTLSLYLGKDKNIQSNRSEKSILHKRTLAGNYTLEETFIDISFKNTSAEALLIEVLDQVPVFEKDNDEKLNVFNIGKTDYDKQEGLLTWHYKLKPGENTSISFKYEVKSPRSFHKGAKRKYKYRSIACPSF